MTVHFRPHAYGCPGRQLLQASANGFGMLALSALLVEQGRGAAAGSAGASPSRAPGLPGVPHFPPRANHVIFCFMDGGVSHVDSFDPKPKLTELDGKAFTDSTNPLARGNRRWPLSAP